MHFSTSVALGTIIAAGKAQPSEPAPVVAHCLRSLTKGGSIRVPVETVLTFQLDKPVQIIEAR